MKRTQGGDQRGSQQIQLVSVDNLLLDADNPRLASAEQGASQQELLKVLWTEMAVDELALSIKANGFFPDEPLLVIPADQKKAGLEDKFIVVEGNRRLAAVLLLRDDRLREKLGATDIPEISKKDKEKLSNLPVSKYSSRQDLWEYFGFRHINGPREWDAYSKAKYVAKVHEEYNVSLPEIANKIGDRHSTVVRLYRGYKILEQAEAQTLFSREDRVRNRFYFSHLYTAADQPEFQEFLGIDPKGSLKRNPVPRSKLRALEELLIWLYGSKQQNREPVVRTQSPDLNTLREIIGKPKAVSLLRSGLSLEVAYQAARGDPRLFRDALTRASEELKQAKARVTTGYRGEIDLFDTIEEILRVAESLRQEMSSRRKQS